MNVPSPTSRWEKRWQRCVSRCGEQLMHQCWWKITTKHVKTFPGDRVWLTATHPCESTHSTKPDHTIHVFNVSTDYTCRDTAATAKNTHLGKSLLHRHTCSRIKNTKERRRVMCTLMRLCSRQLAGGGLNTHTQTHTHLFYNQFSSHQRPPFC